MKAEIACLEVLESGMLAAGVRILERKRTQRLDRDWCYYRVFAAGREQEFDVAEATLRRIDPEKLTAHLVKQLILTP